MSRRLLALNILLAALCGLAGWRLATNQKTVESRRASFLSHKPQAPVVVPPIFPQPPQPVAAANYLQVATELLFSKDRNPNVVIETPPPKVMPPMPQYYGLMSFGGPPKVVLGIGGSDKPKSYLAGERIGDFRLLSIHQTGLVFEWEGQKVGARYAEIRAKQAAPQQPGASAAKPSQPPSITTSASGAPVVSSASPAPSAGAPKPAATSNRPGEMQTSTMRSCVPGDTNPPGAVVDGYRKIVNNTPFGLSCRWEKVQ